MRKVGEKLARQDGVVVVALNAANKPVQIISQKFIQTTIKSLNLNGAPLFGPSKYPALHQPAPPLFRHPWQVNASRILT